MGTSTIIPACLLAGNIRVWPNRLGVPILSLVFPWNFWDVGNFEVWCLKCWRWRWCDSIPLAELCLSIVSSFQSSISNQLSNYLLNHEHSIHSLSVLSHDSFFLHPSCLLNHPAYYWYFNWRLYFFSISSTKLFHPSNRPSWFWAFPLILSVYRPIPPLALLDPSNCLTVHPLKSLAFSYLYHILPSIHRSPILQSTVVPPSNPSI